MNIKQYLDSTYLKTAEQAEVSADENREVVKNYIHEAIIEQFKLIMIRPNMVAMAREMMTNESSKVAIGTVIDFPLGNSPIDGKLLEANEAIQNGADDLDFVVNYQAFKKGEIQLVKDEVLQCTKLGRDHKKVVKWIIEVAALNPQQIVQLSALIKNVVVTHFDDDHFPFIFVKSSTGFFKTENNLPNGATKPAIIMMLENASPLPIKAAGGVRNYDEAVEMIRLGVKRIGTSSAKAIADGQQTASDY